MLLAFTGHGMILNSAALQFAHIDETIGDPEGGIFDRDASGLLNGRVGGKIAHDTGVLGR